ncbi:MAG: hypothetical protein ACLPJH_06040 [Myxococcaceae bacterium]
MLTALVALLVAATPAEEVPISFLKTVQPHSGSPGGFADGAPKAYGGHGNGGGGGSSVPGIDSIANWTGQFTSPGFDSNGNPQSVWPYAMVGGSPDRGGVTVIPAPIIPVVVDLLDANGSVAVRNGVTLSVSPAAVVQPVVQSPLFEPFLYDSGFTQFNDAEFRSTFWDRISQGGGWGGGDNGWHTLLQPNVKKTRHMAIPYGYWAYALNPDGTCCAFVLLDENAFSNALFPPSYPVDNSTVIGAAELAGDMTTRDLTTFLFKDVYLYSGTPSNCCVLGFHTYDLEPGIPANGNLPRLYLMAYASWISPGLFSFGFQDIAAMSHELAESFNDPFIDNLTPWWLSVDPVFGYAQCQNLLEVGDVVEVLDSQVPTFSIYSRQQSRTYHPQNVANLKWFEFQSPSKALNGAYSFPDETTLPALSPPNLLPNCVPAP